MWICPSGPLTKFEGGLTILHWAEDDAVKWRDWRANFLTSHSVQRRALVNVTWHGPSQFWRFAVQFCSDHSLTDTVTYCIQSRVYNTMAGAACCLGSDNGARRLGRGGGKHKCGVFAPRTRVPRKSLTRIPAPEPAPTDSVALSVCWSRPWALQKRLNRSRCRLGCGLVRSKKTTH